MSAPYSLIDAGSRLGSNADGLFVHSKQEIDDDFMASLHSERLAKAHMRSAELDRVASVPTLVWDLWTRQGRNPQQASARQIVAWLNAEHLSAFITTPKAV